MVEEDGRPASVSRRDGAFLARFLIDIVQVLKGCWSNLEAEQAQKDDGGDSHIWVSGK